MQRSYTVNVCRVETSPVEDHPRSVFVAPSGVSTAFADERSISQLHLGLVSRTTGGASHCSVCGIDQNHIAPSSGSHGNQYSLGHANRTISSFLGHRGLGKEPRLEVLDSNVTESHYHAATPFESPVFALTGHADMDGRNGTLCGLSVLSVTFGAGQFAIRLLQCIGVVLGLIATGQVEAAIGGGSNFSHTPIYTNGLVGDRECFRLAPNNERYEPMSLTIAGYHAGLWLTRQCSAPHDRNSDAACKAENSVLQAESIGGVLHAWKRHLAALELRKAFGGLIERLLVRCRPPTHGLLLNTLGALTKPFVFSSPRGKSLGYTNECWAFVPFFGFICGIGGIASLNTLVPHPARTVPFEEQASFGSNAGSQAVRVPQRSLVLAHEAKITFLTAFP